MSCIVVLVCCVVWEPILVMYVVVVVVVHMVFDICVCWVSQSTHNVVLLLDRYCNWHATLRDPIFERVRRWKFFSIKNLCALCCCCCRCLRVNVMWYCMIIIAIIFDHSARNAAGLFAFLIERWGGGIESHLTRITSLKYPHYPQISQTLPIDTARSFPTRLIAVCGWAKMVIVLLHCDAI